MIELLLELLSAGMKPEDILADYEDLQAEDILAALAFATKLLQVKSIHGLVGVRNLFRAIAVGVRNLCRAVAVGVRNLFRAVAVGVRNLFRPWSWHGINSGLQLRACFFSRSHALHGNEKIVWCCTGNGYGFNRWERNKFSFLERDTDAYSN